MTADISNNLVLALFIGLGKNKYCRSILIKAMAFQHTEPCLPFSLSQGASHYTSHILLVISNSVLTEMDGTPGQLAMEYAYLIYIVAKTQTQKPSSDHYKCPQCLTTELGTWNCQLRASRPTMVQQRLEMENLNRNNSVLCSTIPTNYGCAGWERFFVFLVHKSMWALKSMELMLSS